MAARPRVTSRSARMRRVDAVEQGGGISGVGEDRPEQSPTSWGGGLVPGVLVDRLVRSVQTDRVSYLSKEGRVISAVGSGTAMCWQELPEGIAQEEADEVRAALGESPGHRSSGSGPACHPGRRRGIPGKGCLVQRRSLSATLSRVGAPSRAPSTRRW